MIILFIEEFAGWKVLLVYLWHKIVSGNRNSAIVNNILFSFYHYVAYQSNDKEYEEMDLGVMNISLNDVATLETHIPNTGSLHIYSDEVKGKVNITFLPEYSPAKITIRSLVLPKESDEG